MSRHNFTEILANHAELVLAYQLDEDEANPNEPRDTQGNRLSAWFEEALVGWDEPLQTYFFQCIEVGDGLVWWFGTNYGEIPTFEDLCGVINTCFSGGPAPSLFRFVDAIDKSMD